MKRFKHNPQRMPRHDYEIALKSAVSWLGDRYLLAEPVTRRIEERKPYFAESRSWHDPRRPMGPARRRH